MPAMLAPITGCSTCPFNSDGPAKRSERPVCTLTAYTTDGRARAAWTEEGMRPIDADANGWCPIKGDGIQVYRD
jgi:hypothetical protein